MALIDLRSDTVTLPTKAMRDAMDKAKLGDDVYGEDPTVNELERYTADLLGFQAALFVSSGTQSNLLGLMSHCERGDEYIVGQTAHTYKFEGGGAAVLGSIQPQPIPFEQDGSLDLAKVKDVVKPIDFHFARTRLLCLENSQAGKVLPLDYIRNARELCDELGLALHMDGARLFNAAVKQRVEPKQIAQHMDSISVCLSKGLGAPVGSVLCASEAFISRARRWRQVLGGGMRQAGILAACGLHALKNHVQRLEDDHANALLLAEGLADIDELRVDPHDVQTNMVFLQVSAARAKQISARLQEKGVLTSPGSPMRCVTHLDIDESAIRTTIREMKAICADPERLSA